MPFFTSTIFESLQVVFYHFSVLTGRWKSQKYCGAVALADVTSANVVGYQNKAARQGFTYITPTFRSLTVVNKIPLKEIQLDASVQSTFANLQFVNTNGGASYDNDGNILQYIWINAADKALTKYADLEFPAGGNGTWAIAYAKSKYSTGYREPDPSKGEPNEIDIGQGLQLQSPENSKVTFSGQVGDETYAVLTRQARSGFTYFGNPFPVDIPLTNIQLDSSVQSTFANLQFVNTNGGASFDNDGNVLQYIWVNAADKTLAKYADLTFPTGEGVNGTWAIAYAKSKYSTGYRNPDPTKGEPQVIPGGDGIQVSAPSGSQFWVLCPYDL